MRVITNTSPLLYLHAIQQLELLQHVYSTIVVPQAVVDELRIGHQQGYDVPDCQTYGWMQIETVAIPAVLKLVTHLGIGEAEVLAIALATPTDLVLLDDALARQVATSQGIRFTGTPGVLIRAKEHGYLTTVMPLVEAMQHAGCHISDTLKATIRRIVAE
jgi:predicted nucleic acid-binding protein